MSLVRGVDGPGKPFTGVRGVAPPSNGEFVADAALFVCAKRLRDMFCYRLGRAASRGRRREHGRADLRVSPRRDLTVAWLCDNSSHGR